MLGALFGLLCCYAAGQDVLEGRHGIRGHGAVHILADAGMLKMGVSKRDLNIYEGAESLRVRLVSPDRRVLAETVFEDDGNTGKGGMGPLETRVLTWQVLRPGLFKLDVVVSSSDICWGVATSSSHYVIESRLLFKRPEIGGTICFMPPDEPFAMTLGNQGVSVDTRLADRDGREIRSLELKPKTPPEELRFETPRNHPGPWQLTVSRQMLQADIQGVTTFPGGGGSAYYPERPYWTDDTEAWFDVARLRWLVTPFRRVLYCQPGEEVRVAFDLYNGGASPDTLRLDISRSGDLAGGGEGIQAQLVPGTSLDLDAAKSATVTVKGQVPEGAAEGSACTLWLRASLASDPALSTYASIDVRIGGPPWDEPLPMPIVLKPYEHENVQFGYAPDYIPNAPYFDRLNRPYIRWRTRHRHHSRAVDMLAADGWRRGDFTGVLREMLPGFTGTWFSTYSQGVKTAFDGDNRAYTLVTAVVADRPRRIVLLTSNDDLASYEAHLFDADPDATAYEIEQFTGHNRTAAPPPILLYTPSGERITRWATPHRLSLYLPSRQGDGRLDLGPPTVITESCVGVAAHSGGASAIASHDDKVHIVWGETVPADADVPGVPTYVVTYDCTTGVLGDKVLLAYGPPVNDVHNSPGIVLDSKGYLHVITGAHGEPFYYVRSRQPGDAYAGWTDPIPVLSAGRKHADTDADGRGAQTYLGLVCGPDDSLHIACRQWRANVDPFFDGALYAALSYQRKPAGEPWGPARPLVVPPLPGYSVYYHKLTLDRIGRIYLGYSYYSENPCYRHDLPGRLDHQAVIMSGDHGQTWRLVRTKDFAEGVELAAEGSK